MNDSKRINIARIFLREHYLPLKEYFASAWEDSPENEAHRYYVFFYKKCLNLNEIFFQSAVEEASEDERERLISLRRRTFLTQSGLVMKAPELADAYIAKEGVFPSIFLFDELVITGNDYAELVRALYWAVLYELKHRDVSAHLVNETFVFKRLLSAIDFIPYKNEAPQSFLLDSEYIRQMQIKKCDSMSTKEWAAFSHTVCATIVFSPIVECTSYVPSFWLRNKHYHFIEQKIPKSSEKQLTGWNKESWKYRNRRIAIWSKNNYDEDDQLVLQQAVRCSFFSQTDEYVLTPFLFWNALEEPENRVLLLRISNRIEEFISARPLDRETGDSLTRIADILKSTVRYSQEIRNRLFITIGSILVAWHFVEVVARVDYSAEPLFLRNDLEKVSQCFGSICEIYPGLALLAEDDGARVNQLRKDIWDDLRNYLLANADPLTKDDVKDEKPGRDAYLLKAEDFLDACAQRQQNRIIYRREHQINYSRSSQFYDDTSFLPDYLQYFPFEYRSFSRKIGALLVLMQWGVADMSIHRRACEISEDASDDRLEFYLRAGEAMPYAIALRMSRFLPALSKLERLSSEQLFCARNMIQKFGRYLNDKNRCNDYEIAFLRFYDWSRAYGKKLSDWNNLNLLWLDQPNAKEQVRTIQEWNNKPWSPEDWDEINGTTHETVLSQNKEKDQKSYTRYLAWEERRQKKCLEELDNFLNN